MFLTLQKPSLKAVAVVDEMLNPEMHRSMFDSFHALGIR